VKRRQPPEKPDFDGQLPSADPRDWRSEDLKRQRGARALGQLGALLLLPLTLLVWSLSTAHRLTLLGMAMIAILAIVPGYYVFRVVRSAGSMGRRTPRGPR
jgi:hypothetical protein